jgi:hypothetical protein
VERLPRRPVPAPTGRGSMRFPNLGESTCLDPSIPGRGWHPFQISTARSSEFCSVDGAFSRKRCFGSCSSSIIEGLRDSPAEWNRFRCRARNPSGVHRALSCRKRLKDHQKISPLAILCRSAVIFQFRSNFPHHFINKVSALGRSKSRMLPATPPFMTI